MIEVSNLTYTYPGASRPAIKRHEFRVEKGEVFGFLGPSGAGKSTTQNILIGLLQGWQGSVKVMSRPLAEWGRDYFRHIGVSFELPNHYLKLTARENLEYFRSLYGDAECAAVEEVLEAVGLGDDVDRRVSTFSKGMKNRLNLARSLLHGPKLWFLDEPTSGLDPVNALQVRELILGKKALGVTTVLTTHDMHTAETICDRVAFIVAGELAVIESPATLRQQYGQRAVELTWEDGERQSFELDGLADNAEFQAGLRRPGLATLHSQETSLEDVFVRVTGRALA